MKNFKSILSLVVAFAIGLSMFLTSCTKEESLVPVTNEPILTERPDFATLDTRPAEEIAQYQVVETEPVALTSLKAGGKYALVIGISNYSGTANDLTYCDEDADDWKARLMAEGYTVTIIKDLSATKTAIEAAINTLASQSVAGNEIAFVYSGHGSKGNIISTDLYYISYTWFKTKFTNSTSTKMFFTFDACQIGYMTTALSKTGRVIAVASSKTTYGYDGDATMQNGVFTYYQMQAFDQLGYIYAEEDCSYAVTKMKAWANTAGVRVAPSYLDNYTGNLDL